LLVVSEPAGADVDLDGKPTGDKTPTALRGLRAGEHTVRFRHPSFSALERSVTLTADGRQLVEVHLLPRSHPLELQTVPAGARVFLDGGLVAAATPVTVELSDGDYHMVRIEKPGYETVLKRLKPDDDEAQLAPIVLSAETEPRGTVFVDASLPHEVWIDGQYSGFRTPTPGLLTSVGEHEVLLKDDAGVVLDRSRVKVAQGETLRVSLQAKRAEASR
jgi:hypothetical protein